MLYWRTASGPEVDLVIERAAGSLVAIECKWKEHPDASDSAGLRALDSVEGKLVKEKMIVCHTPAAYQLADGTWDWVSSFGNPESTGPDQGHTAVITARRAIALIACGTKSTRRATPPCPDASRYGVMLQELLVGPLDPIARHRWILLPVT